MDDAMFRTNPLYKQAGHLADRKLIDTTTIGFNPQAQYDIRKTLSPRKNKPNGNLGYNPQDNYGVKGYLNDNKDSLYAILLGALAVGGGMLAHSALSEDK